MTELLHSIQSMPLAGVVPAFMLLIAGFVLWLAGRRLLRGAFILVGLLLGALIGLLMDQNGQSGMPGWVAPTLGGVILAVVAAITYRLAAAMMMAIALGIACPICVIAVNDWQVERGRGITAEGDEQIVVSDSITSAIEKHQEELDHAKAALQNAKEQVTTRLDELASKYGLQDQAAAGMQQAKSVGTAIADAIVTQWNATPKRLKPTVLLAAMIGTLSGLVLGLVLRKFSDCAVTAMIGAAIWLSAAQVIALRSGAPDGPWFPKSTIAWLGVWLIAAIIGLVVQWARRGGPADKPA